ncbi:MAG: hypothetical protein HC913_19505 [Microscillaceae bacterium]|nr:hypothetical protein [Microscillaceae bacterium]
MQKRIWWLWWGLVLVLGLTLLTPQLVPPQDKAVLSAHPPPQKQAVRVSPAFPRLARLAPHPDYQPLAQLLAAQPGTDSLHRAWARYESVKTHYQAFNQGWQNLEQSRLTKLRRWAHQELDSLQKQRPFSVFYPFSGPDFLNVAVVFPQAQTYLLFGLEPMGELPALSRMQGQYLEAYLLNIRQALSEIFQRNYFITVRMGQAFNTNVKGVLPILLVFLARTGHEILSIEAVFLDNQGQASFLPLGQKAAGLPGLRIRFQAEEEGQGQPKELFYFPGDLANAAFQNKKNLQTFIQSFPRRLTLVKSASYLMHTSPFSLIRQFILDHTEACVQDDTGLPYAFMKKAGWQVKLYGKYARPIRDFNHGYQPDLAQIFEKEAAQIPNLDFTFGYHWWTDKSSILLGQKP